MPTAIIRITGSVGGVTISGQIDRTEEGQLSQQVSLPAAEAGLLTTRVDAHNGTITMSAAHSISTGDVIDIFWTDANGVLKCAYGATVGTVNALIVPFTTSAGNDLPLVADAFTLYVDEVVVVHTNFDGDDLAIIMLQSDRDGHFNFIDVGDASLKQALLVDDEPWFWVSGCGITNPLTGNPVDELLLTNAEALVATVKLGALYSSVA